MVQTVTIGDTTYSSTTASSAIVLADADFANVQATQKVTDTLYLILQRLNI